MIRLIDRPLPYQNKNRALYTTGSTLPFLSQPTIIWQNLISDCMNDIPPLAPLPRDQRAVDEDHLNLLSIFHFVGAGFAVLGMLFLMAHFAMMHFIFTNAALWQDQKQGPPPAAFFGFFIFFYLLIGLWLMVSAILNVLSGIFLRARRYRTFSFVVAGINCVHVPFGTILGIFTIVVLARTSVSELYARAAHHYV
jgi:hypothetical protein